MSQIKNKINILKGLAEIRLKPKGMLLKGIGLKPLLFDQPSPLAKVGGNSFKLVALDASS